MSRLETIELAGVGLVVGDDHEVDIARLIEVADRQGAEQVEADEVVLQGPPGGLGVVDQNLIDEASGSR